MLPNGFSCFLTLQTLVRKHNSAMKTRAYKHTHLLCTHPYVTMYLYTRLATFICYNFCLAPVCTTEIAEIIRLLPVFRKMDVQPIGLSVDSVKLHHQWAADIERFMKYQDEVMTELVGSSSPSPSQSPAHTESPAKPFPFPFIADEDGDVACLLGMLDQPIHDATNIKKKGGKTLPLTVRGVYILDDSLRLRASYMYPATVGRSWVEVIRVLLALRKGDQRQIATPEGWNPGAPVLIRANITDDEAKILFPSHQVPVPCCPYIRYVPDINN